MLIDGIAHSVPHLKAVISGMKLLLDKGMAAILQATHSLKECPFTSQGG